jgi:hypothetical protein
VVAPLADRAAPERPPRDRRLRWPLPDRFPTAGPSCGPASAGPSSAPGAGPATSPDTASAFWARLTETFSPVSEAFAWVEGRRPERRRRLRLGRGDPGAACSSPDSPPDPSSSSSPGAVTSFICSLNARPSCFLDRAQAGAAAAQEAWMKRTGSRAPGGDTRCSKDLVGGAIRLTSPASTRTGTPLPGLAACSRRSGPGPDGDRRAACLITRPLATPRGPATKDISSGTPTWSPGYTSIKDSSGPLYSR